MPSDYRLSDLLDMSHIQRLADSNFQATGLPMSIIDAFDTSILVRAGWTDACMKFHRANPLSNQRCLESDASVQDRLVEGGAHQYKCQNGLWHVTIPIMVAGRQLAMMMLTQFYFEGEVPERDFFIRQGREFGYDLEAYLAALDRLPVFSLEKVNYIIAYNKALVRFIADQAEQSLKIKAAQKSLHNREEQYRAVINNVNIGIFRIMAGQGRYIQVNPAMARIFGYDSGEELLATDSTNLYQDPADRQGYIEEIRRRGFVKDREVPMRKKDGTPIWCSLTANAQCDENRRITWVDGVLEDITQRKAAAEELQKAHVELEQRVEARTAELAKAKEYLENIFASSAEAIGIVDERGLVRKWNQAAEEIYGYAFAEIEGKSPYDLYADRDELERMITQLRRHGFVRDYEINMKKKNGSIFPCSLSVKMIYGDDRKVIGSVTIARDLTELKDSLAKLHLANERLQTLVAESDRRNRQMTLLQEMNDFFQSCQTSEETYDAIAHFGPKFYPGYTGALYLLNNSETLFEMEASWGEASSLEAVFGHDECWALRRSRVYLVTDPHSALNCPHVSSTPAGYLCLPMMAQGKAIGILHLQKLSVAQPEQMQAIEPYAQTVAEAMGMALANLKLRETLHNQAIRDGLTGLFNRRYLNETMERELSRGKRLGSTTGVIMMDLDHFKEYNDIYGHHAGDELLVALGKLIRWHTRQEDIACRYGGEEFLIIMPGAPLEVVVERARELNQNVKQLHLQNRSLQAVTISAGVALYPSHGASSKEVIRSADAALYRAKAEGRDRVVVADGAHLGQTVVG